MLIPIPDRYVLDHAPASNALVPTSLAPGTELLGRYESPGMTDERYLVRRADGQTILLTQALYLIATGLAAQHSIEAISRDVSVRLDQSVSPDTIATVIDTKLAPLGILPSIETTEAVPTLEAPLLSMSLRATLVGPRAVRFLARVFGSFYDTNVIIVWLSALLMADLYVFGVHGVSSSLTLVARHPLLFLPILGIVVAGTLFHEIGHATACAYGGGKPGRIGFGVYLIFPAFYTDVSDTYRLPRRARVRTDLGGVYFNGIFIVVSTMVLAATNYLPLIPAIVFIHITMFQQMLPVVRLDGYYVLSDLVGVPDLFGRIKPIMGRLIGRHDPRANQLAPSARRIVTAWVLIAVPVIVGGFALFIWRLPTFISNTIDGLQAQWASADNSYHHGHWAGLAIAVISLLLLCLPVLGASAFVIRLTKRIPTRRKAS